MTVGGTGSLHPEPQPFPHPVCLVPGVHEAMATGPTSWLSTGLALPQPQPLPAIPQDWVSNKGPHHTVACEDELFEDRGHA